MCFSDCLVGTVLVGVLACEIRMRFGKRRCQRK